MKLDRQRREIKSIDLLPLINVVFLLILFVLIAGRPTTDHPQHIEVATSRHETDYKAAAMAVWLKQDNQFYLASGEQMSAEEVAVYMQERDIGVQGLPVELIADRRAHAGALLAFRRAMEQAGIGEIRIKTEHRAIQQGR